MNCEVLKPDIITCFVRVSVLPVSQQRIVMSKDSGQPSVRRVSLPAPISPTYNFASPVTTSGGRRVSVKQQGSIFERNGGEQRKLSVVWARHTPGITPLRMSSLYHCIA